MLNLNASVIDSRDIIARLAELESEKEDLVDRIRDIQDMIDNSENTDIEDLMDQKESAQMELDVWESDNEDELNMLASINDEGEQASSDWTHGETLISSDYWVDYCKELCGDYGYLPKDVPSFIAIDWDQTAENISADYTTIEIDGTDYYIRSC
jgi:hypothetical protein